MSPLAEGRELKLKLPTLTSFWNPSPLAEGRELKLWSDSGLNEWRVSPLAEGRELKFMKKGWFDDNGFVAPRGGA